MGGPYCPTTSIHINNQVVGDISWLIDHICSLSGIFMLDSIAWHSIEANLVIYTDACPQGIGFWSPQLDCGCYGGVASVSPTLPIFFHEASAVICALHWLSLLRLRNICHLVVYSNNTNTVNIFHSLKARGFYNRLLKIAVNLLMQANYDLCVLHIAGLDNTDADALLRHQLPLVTALCPSISLKDYQPPPVVAEAAQELVLVVGVPGYLRTPGHLTYCGPGAHTTLIPP